MSGVRVPPPLLVGFRTYWAKHRKCPQPVARLWVAGRFPARPNLPLPCLAVLCVRLLRRNLCPCSCQVGIHSTLEVCVCWVHVVPRICWVHVVPHGDGWGVAQPLGHHGQGVQSHPIAFAARAEGVPGWPPGFQAGTTNQLQQGCSQVGMLPFLRGSTSTGADAFARGCCLAAQPVQHEDFHTAVALDGLGIGVGAEGFSTAHHVEFDAFPFDACCN